MQPSMERLSSSAGGLHSGPGGNGEGYEGIHKFRAFAFQAQRTPCGLAYATWIEFDTDTGRGAKYDTCSGRLLRNLVASDLTFASYKLVIVDGEIYEIRAQAEANSVDPATENFAVAWCTGIDPGDARNTFEFAAHGIGGKANFTLEARYTVYDAGGNAKTGTHAPETVVFTDDGTEYQWDNTFNFKIHFDYTAPLASGAYAGFRVFIEIDGTVYRPDVECRYRPYWLTP